MANTGLNKHRDIHLLQQFFQLLISLQQIFNIDIPEKGEIKLHEDRKRGPGATILRAGDELFTSALEFFILLWCIGEVISQFRHHLLVYLIERGFELKVVLDFGAIAILDQLGNRGHELPQDITAWARHIEIYRRMVCESKELGRRLIGLAG